MFHVNNYDGCLPQILFDGNSEHSTSCFILLHSTSRIAIYIYYLLRYALNPVNATSLFLWPLKTLDNICFFRVSRGYRKRSMA